VKKVRVLMYNNIGTYPEAAMEDGLSAEAFQRDMAYLASHGYRIVSLDEAMALAKGKRYIPDNVLSLSFDGGYKDAFENVRPILEKFGFPATFFISCTHIGASMTLGGIDIPCMNRAEIKQLADAGYEIGAYVLSGHIYHPHAEESEHKLISDLQEATTWFHEKLGKELRYCSVREGVPEKRLFTAFKEAGIEGFLTKCPTKRRPHHYCVGRIQVDDDDPNIFRIKISKNYLRFKDSRFWRYIRKYKLDRLAHMISDSINKRRS